MAWPQEISAISFAACQSVCVLHVRDGGMRTWPSGRRKPVWLYMMGPTWPEAAVPSMPADLPSSSSAAPVRMSSRLARLASCMHQPEVWWGGASKTLTEPIRHMRSTLHAQPDTEEEQLDAGHEHGVHAFGC